MTGKERVLEAFHCKKPDRVPWVPFVGCHAASLLKVTATAYLQSDELIVRGIKAAVDLYAPDGIPVMFDLQLEAEQLGCELKWADDNPPAVTGHPLASGVTLEQLPLLDPNSGRIKTALQACRVVRKNHPDLALYGLITGPFTLALHLLGTDIFMQMFDQPEAVHRLLSYCSKIGIQMAKAYVDAGCDIVAVVDPMTSQIGPDQFRDFVTPHALPLFDSIRETGALSSFFVCGHAQQNLEAMCECKPHNVSVDENIPLDVVRDICLSRGISFGGNLQLTAVLLLGKPQDAQQNALACLEIGRDTGFVLAPGCDLPYATPPENLTAVTRIANDPYERKIAGAMAREKSAQELLDMNEYGQADRVIVDIVTLDSEACAPCQYMVEAVTKIAPEFEGIVKWREHKIKYKESLVFMTSLMVRNIPTICIDGKITFVSRIPAKEELIAAIQNRINEKMRLKIQRRKAALILLGQGPELVELRNSVEKARMELGVEIDVRVIEDEKEIHGYGIARNQTPAVVLSRHQIKSTRRVPEPAIIKEWLKDLL